MAKRALTALRVMDAIDRRGSFAAAARWAGALRAEVTHHAEAGKKSWTFILFRSLRPSCIHNVGRMLLERGRVLLEAANKLTTDAEALAAVGKRI